MDGKGQIVEKRSDFAKGKIGDGDDRIAVRDVRKLFARCEVARQDFPYRVELRGSSSRPR